ncbi:hypothetical protein [Salegentibacter mishustinae]|uniref:Uncharacterized protein n=1 Tax=Salegentibacter mishustinae TaxID=270918 RepID=A0A0Q9ZBB8_9FLAO|nr:hypothetical protein [Salegentibacter mishustinae]KRG30316.1 hypothetical protein APR42_00190 [Salegentibacter mishustinae]PNW23211.1 hypothetical protein APB85_00185 [Salegentibacter mishustinae]PZX66270.1 hypothetical protein LY54_00662 [Salegentibacter mishustinae]GGW81488.1 hypothetical protein GCM10008086_06340 [Salegentibacter mishustinae]
MYWELTFSILAFIISCFSLFISIIHFRRKRKDDLFKLRFEFYKKISNAWTSTYNKNNSEFDIVDLTPVAEEAEFLFGKDIQKHILSLENKRAKHDLFPDDNFSEPFRKYLKLR